MIRAPSARQTRGINLAVLDPAALAFPARIRAGHLFSVGDGLLATREMSSETMRFGPEDFGL